MREDITRKRYFAIREYPLEHEDFEVEDMFPDGYTRAGVGDWVENMPKGILANENGESVGIGMAMLLKGEA